MTFMRIVKPPTSKWWSPAGNFRATKIAMHIYSGATEMQQMRFTLWLARNAARTPAAMEAELPFGTFRLELAQITAARKKNRAEWR